MNYILRKIYVRIERKKKVSLVTLSKTWTQMQNKHKSVAEFFSLVIMFSFTYTLSFVQTF